MVNGSRSRARVRKAPRRKGKEMNDIKQMIDQAHKSADQAIKKAQTNARMASVKEYLTKPVVVYRLHLGVMIISLFGFIAYELLIY